ncbi:adenosylcobinamide-phosphate synthase CbiB [Halorubellus sp. PRR65]|uniref:adenosylcobinamide-phosphate synthase CbiB n=1 Tax=Halorubellus sp. PRR65 TaxID=3098148 RepID=UPI002B2611B0|nr:adenosylcobinamide-phosphate synthase CbiB [Halorubellus sp. PRR65]
MSALGALVVVAAVGLDAAVGEPPNRLHPVAWFGRIVALADRDWSNPAVVGAAVAVGLPLAAAAAVAGVVLAVGYVHPWLSVAAAVLAVFATTSRRMLLALARDVVAATDRDLARAREDLLGLAGRDAGGLSPAQMRSAAVESAAENLADGLVAPLGAFAVALPFGIAAGAGAAAWVKAVNTLDSMLGYPGKRHGTASARLDDLVMWIPARASAGLLAFAGGRPRSVLAAREWLAGVPSPNSGWPMGVLAAAVDVRLEKSGVYVLNPDAPLPPTPVAERALAVVDRAGWLAVATAAALALAVPTPAEVLALP